MREAPPIEEAPVARAGPRSPMLFIGRGGRSGHKNPESVPPFRSKEDAPGTGLGTEGEIRKHNCETMYLVDARVFLARLFRSSVQKFFQLSAFHNLLLQE